MILLNFVLASMFASAERGLKLQESTDSKSEPSGSGYLSQLMNFLWQSGESGYQHVWPVSQTYLSEDSMFKTFNHFFRF